MTAIMCAAALVVQIAGLTILGRNAWYLEGLVHFFTAKAVLVSGPLYTLASLAVLLALVIRTAIRRTPAR